MVASGDQIHRIEGVMSGTLGFLCSRLEEGILYSQAVQEAYESGYTEPDPRDDLSGFDVLRKSLILGRTAGWNLEQNLILRYSHFMMIGWWESRSQNFSKAHNYSTKPMRNRSRLAKSEGRVLRYLATITPQGGSIGLKAVERSSALGSLHGPGNYFAFYSQHYNEIPLVIAGPGAGITVTANGVLNDIIALSSCSR